MTKNILIFPAGTEIGLEIFNSLKYEKNVKIHGAGEYVSNPAIFIFNKYHVIPPISDPSWLALLNELCEKLRIDCIYPAHDDVILALSRNVHKLNATLITSSPSTCEVTRFKSKTYKHLRDVVRVPKIYESINQVTNFPVFIKPDCGQGSMGVAKINDFKQLMAALHSVESPIITEYLPGEEFTVDCFSDGHRGLLYASARTRKRTRNGISVHTDLVKLPEAFTMASKISASLSMRGAWFFQIKRADDGEFVLLEVAPRIAGSMAANRVTGVNFPLLSIYERDGIHVNVNAMSMNIEMDRALSNRYRHTIEYDTVYIDLDDTLLIGDKVNLIAVKLLFMSINSGKYIVLVTRHKGDIRSTLATYRLSSLFDEVIFVDSNEKKSTYITRNKAIFIDDSYAERMDVSINCMIPTFDCSMIEMLTEQAEFLNEEN